MKTKKSINTGSKLTQGSSAYSQAQMKQLEKMAKEKQSARQKELISLRVDHESIEMAKSFGKGYTQIFSRLIYIGMRDPKILKKAL